MAVKTASLLSTAVPTTPFSLILFYVTADLSLFFFLKPSGGLLKVCGIGVDCGPVAARDGVEEIDGDA